MKAIEMISTATDTYLITFSNGSQQTVIVNYYCLSDALNKLNKGFLLANIYRLNPSKLKFQRVPKSKYRSLFSYDTEVMEILTKHKIIK